MSTTVCHVGHEDALPDKASLKWAYVFTYGSELGKLSGAGKRINLICCWPHNLFLTKRYDLLYVT